MGGRGTFAAGKSVPYTFKTVTELDGIKVLEGINGVHGLPASSHSSKAYIQLNSDGSFRELRLYDKNHVLYFELGFHREPSLNSGPKPVLHYHLYDPRFSTLKTGSNYRSKAIKATKAMKKRFKSILGGILK